jgi:molybdopterin-guanine dinucleotide biosynthesis protein A
VPIAVAALLLTGGASRRMGRDKAELVVDGERLADRSARLLQLVADPVVEVGPGFTALPRVVEAERGGGPLVAMAAGAGRLAAVEATATLVLAVDMPHVDHLLLAHLAAHPSEVSVVPVDRAGRLQPLCARYSPAALDCARALAVTGARSMHELLDAVPYTVLGQDEWGPVAAAADPFADLDTPADLERL